MQNILKFFENPLTVLYLLLFFNLVVAGVVIIAANFIRKAMKNIVKVTKLQLDASKQMEIAFTSMLDTMVKMTELRKQMVPVNDDKKTKKISR